MGSQGKNARQKNPGLSLEAWLKSTRRNDTRRCWFQIHHRAEIIRVPLGCPPSGALVFVCTRRSEGRRGCDSVRPGAGGSGLPRAVSSGWHTTTRVRSGPSPAAHAHDNALERPQKEIASRWVEFPAPCSRPCCLTTHWTLDLGAPRDDALPRRRPFYSSSTSYFPEWRDGAAGAASSRRLLLPRSSSPPPLPPSRATATPETAAAAQSSVPTTK